MKRNSPRAGDASGLSPDRILELAVAAADRGGLAAVSIRGLARELEVTPMALYWHFASKDALLDAMAERTVADAHFTDSPGADWQERCRGVLHTLVDLLQDHPWMGRLLIERLVPLPNYLSALEILLDAARQAGLDPNDGTVLAQQAVQSVITLVECEPRMPPDKDPQVVAAECEAHRQVLADLSADDYPNIRAAAVPLSTPTPLPDYYRLGIETIVGGIGVIAAGR